MTDKPSQLGARTVVVPNEEVGAAGLRVVVAEGPNRGAALAITRARHTVGRHPTNDLVIEDPAVSLVHVELLRASGNLLRARDAISTNGTWLGSNQIVEALLAPGTSIKIGSSVLRLEIQPVGAQASLSPKGAFEGLVGESVEMRELFAVLERVAPKNLSVLIEGETGTGKEEVARALHARSTRKAAPLVVLDAASIPPTLAESTMFGHERGAFTGAEARHLGAFERANNGTIFIDEVGELPLELQPKLLRVLERREVVRVGGREPLAINVRVIAATRRDLRLEVESGRFRDDLYYRIAQVRLVVPPLRSRCEDIALLARTFLDHIMEVDNSRVTIDEQALREIMGRPWPGNVRELKNVVQRAAALCDDGRITTADLGGGGFGFGGKPTETDAVDLTGVFAQAKSRAVDRFEVAYLEALMHRCRGNLSRASRESGVARNHLRDLLRKHGLYTPVTE